MGWTGRVGRRGFLQVVHQLAFINVRLQVTFSFILGIEAILGSGRLSEDEVSNWDAQRLLLGAGCRLSEEEVSHWDARRLLLGAAWRDSFPPLASSKPFMIKLRPRTSTFHLDLAKSMFVFFKTPDKAWPR